MVKVMFRCDGGRTPEIGTGHVVRCTRISETLLGYGDVDLSFLMQDNDFSKEYASGARWKVHLFPEGDLKACAKIISAEKPDIFVMDKLDSDAGFMKMARERCRVLVSFDDLGEGARLADIVVNGIVGDGRAAYAGPKYVITPPEIGSSLKKVNKECKDIFVTFGGYDHLNLTLKTARALERLDPAKEVHIIVGNAYPFWEDLNAFLKGAKRQFHVHRTPKDYAALLMGSDLAITSGGLSLFEAMAAGVPALVLAQYEHQAITAKKFEKEGATEFLGMGDKASGNEIMEAVAKLAYDHDARLRMSRRAQGVVDGDGLPRVADLVHVVKPLKWDSEFFKMKIANVNTYRITERMADFIDSWCGDNRVQCLFYLCDCNHAESVRIAEKHGFHFTDIKMCFEMDMDRYGRKAGPADSIRECTKADLPAIMEIAKKSYFQSRYYYDGHFDPKALEKFYSGWLGNTFNSPRGKVFVAHRDGKPVGYISGETDNKGRLGRIILVGVDEGYAGSGLGKSLVDAMLDWMHGQRVYTAEVVTQGRNIPAQRLYEKCGFKIVSANIWYHKWFY